MFREIHLKNFRTHRDTLVKLGPVTLLIGGNNSGKSNLLAGLQHFSHTAAIARRARSDIASARAGNLFPHIHRLAPPGQPMEFHCHWTHELGEVRYSIGLYEDAALPDKVGCRERIKLAVANQQPETIEKGYDDPTSEFLLQRAIESSSLDAQQMNLAVAFFRDLSSCYGYDLQTSFLSGAVGSKNADDPEGRSLHIASQLGREGGNLQALLPLIRQQDERLINKMIASVQRFEPSFRGIGQDPEKPDPMWLFELGRTPARFDEFPPHMVSCGLLKAAAIALLAAMPSPPALILLEELENGINQRNIGSFLRWLAQAAGPQDSSDRGHATQFVVTSHSPSVLREFADQLENVYFMRLAARDYASVATNLSASLGAFVEMGIVDGEFDGEGDQRTVKVSPSDLTELWYSGTIGGGA